MVRKEIIRCDKCNDIIYQHYLIRFEANYELGFEKVEDIEDKHFCSKKCIKKYYINIK